MVLDSLLTLLSPIAMGSLASFHISIPLLICYRRFLFEGRRAGVIASIGTVVGQIMFLSFLTVFGSRSFTFFWYVGEPFFQFLGLMLTLRVFIVQRRPVIHWGWDFSTWENQGPPTPYPRGYRWSLFHYDSDSKNFLTSFFLSWLVPIGFGPDSLSWSLDSLLESGSNLVLSLSLFQMGMLATILSIGLGLFYFFKFYKMTSNLFTIIWKNLVLLT